MNKLLGAALTAALCVPLVLPSAAPAHAAPLAHPSSSSMLVQRAHLPLMLPGMIHNAAIDMNPMDRQTALSRALAAAPSAAAAYQFRTLDNPLNPTDNSLYGINDADKLAGFISVFNRTSDEFDYFGFALNPPYGLSDYKFHHVPGSNGTLVTAINNRDDIAGVWVNNKNQFTSFVKPDGGNYRTFVDPHTATTANAECDIFGLNDNGFAAGSYSDVNGRFHGFALNTKTGAFYGIHPPNDHGSDVFVTGINDAGHIVGWVQGKNGNGGTAVGFVLINGTFTEIALPGAQQTVTWAINGNDEIAGYYVDLSGVAHGFTLKKNGELHTLDDPNGVDGTLLDGINDNGDVVGAYYDATHTQHVFLAKKM